MDYSFDGQAADDAVAFVERYCRHVKGEWAGQRIRLEEWQKDRIIRPLFGTKRPDGTRLYRTAYVEIPRKNAKSTLSSAVALKLLVADGEPGAEVYSAATDKEQARLVFNDACEMVRASPELSKRCRVLRNAITVPATGSTYRALSAEAFTKDGLNAHGIIFDEVHAQPNRELWDVLTTSTGSRRQPLVIAITTAGYDRKSLCWELHAHAERVRDGTAQDPSFLPVIFGADVEDDWTSEEVWHKANPNLGVSLKLEYLREMCAKAKEMPAFENAFRRLHLNQWTEQDVRWMPMAKWGLCAGEIDEEKLRGRRCFGGLDLASTTDVTALCWVFPGENGTFDVLPRFWIPAEGMRERVKRDRAPYAEWVRDGWMSTTPGERTDHAFILKQIADDAEKFDVAELAFDRWGASHVSTALDEGGMKVIPFGQGFASMAAPTKALMSLVLGKELNHGGNPVLRWMAGNVVVEQDAAGNFKPSKKRSTEKIDGIVALIMGLDRAQRNEAPKKSYISNGPIISFG